MIEHEYGWLFFGLDGKVYLAEYNPKEYGPEGWLLPDYSPGANGWCITDYRLEWWERVYP